MRSGCGGCLDLREHDGLVDADEQHVDFAELQERLEHVLGKRVVHAVVRNGDGDRDVARDVAQARVFERGDERVGIDVAGGAIASTAVTTEDESAAGHFAADQDGRVVQLENELDGLLFTLVHFAEGTKAPRNCGERYDVCVVHTFWSFR